jgi:glycine betaine/proline transport system ATP-binding protein
MMEDAMPPKPMPATVVQMPMAQMIAPDAPLALQVKGLWKVFGAATPAFRATSPDERSPEDLARRGWLGAVQDASFAIAKAEVFVIMGLSGSGKSTLLRCLTRLIEPSEGVILLNGQDMCQADEPTLQALRRRHMGMVFQHFALLPNRTVLGNITFPLEVQGIKRAEADARARALIDTVGLSGREGRFPAELSGGQQQRIGIARSLATNPDFWFLDEPFSALDPLIRADLQDEVLRLQRQLAKTVVFVTHDLDEAIKIADRVAIMEGGRIVQIGTPEALVTQPATDYVRRFVAKIPPARVVRVRSLMQAWAGDVLAADPVPASATISDIAPRLIAGAAMLPVVDAAGTRVGMLDRGKALAVLAGGT